MRGSAAFRVAVAPGGALAGPWVRDPLWTRARAVPSLDLRFADNQSLVDAVTGASLVTFTRASTGTYVGSDGLIKTAVTNLLTYSEQFDNAAWTKNNLQAFGSGSVANATIAPNGTLTADKIVENTATAQHMVYQNTTPGIGKAYVLTFYAKAAERIFVTAAFSGGGLASDCRFGVNLNTGEIVSGSTSGSPELTQVTPIGDGWYRIALIKTMPAASGLQPRILMSTNGTAQTYLGDGTSGLFIWGAQLEQAATVGEYIPTVAAINSAPRFDHNPTTGESLGLLVEEARTNLVLRSEEFGTTWTATRASVSTDATLAPSGATTADKLVEDTTVTNTHQIQQAVTLVANTTYATSFYIKSSERTELRLLFSAGTDGINAAFNLSTGVATAQANTGLGVIASATLTPVGNGWFRATATGIISPLSTSATLTLRLLSSGSNSYTGDGTSGLFLWGAQLEAGAFATSYIPTATATVTRAADVPSISGSNYSGWANASEGSLYVEAQSFNSTASTTVLAVISDATLNNRWEVALRAGSAGGAGRTTITSGGSNSFDTGNVASPVFAINQNYKIASAAAADNFGYSFNGGVAVQDSSGAMPVSPNRMEIGNRLGALYINGTIRRLTFWPTRLAGTTLEAISQP